MLPRGSGGQVVTIGDWRSKRARFGALAAVSGPQICDTALEKAENRRVLGRCDAVQFIRRNNGARRSWDSHVLALNFPDNREIYREFQILWPQTVMNGAKTSVFSAP